MAGSKISKEAQKLLTENPFLSLEGKSQKVKCSLSGHEMPCRVDTIKSYVQGKKYKQLVARKQLEMDKYKDLLVTSNKKGHERQLFCKLTLRHLNNQPHHINRHIEGKRFKKAYNRWLECQKTGEKFVPRAGHRRPRVDPDDEPTHERRRGGDDDDSSGDESVDSMSDLYPAADFLGQGEEEEEEDDSDKEENASSSEEEMEIEDSKPPQAPVASSSASKQGKQFSKRTKSKNKMPKKKPKTKHTK